MTVIKLINRKQHITRWHTSRGLKNPCDGFNVTVRCYGLNFCISFA